MFGHLQGIRGLTQQDVVLGICVLAQSHCERNRAGICVNSFETLEDFHRYGCQDLWVGVFRNVVVSRPNEDVVRSHMAPVMLGPRIKHLHRRCTS